MRYWKSHLIFWISVLALFLAIVLIFQSVLTPFIAGIAIAYLLNPAVVALERYKIKRKYATLLIVFVFLTLLLLILAAAIPFLYRELTQLSNDLPSYIDQFLAWVEPYLNQLLNFSDAQDIDLRELAKNHAAKALTVAGGLAGNLMAGGQALIGFVSFMIIAPIVAFFMMNEWPSIVSWSENMMPKSSKPTVKELLSDIDKKLAGFVRGQLIVAVILGVIYAVALSIAGLKYAILIGLIAGALNIIPLVGSTVGLVIGVAVAWFQTGEISFVAIIAAIFITGQIVEGNFLTPKLLGDQVGLHPLWIFFALVAGGSLFGILGMLLAVPVAAVVSVLCAFAIKQYKSSDYYNQSQEQKLKRQKKENGEP